MRNSERKMFSLIKKWQDSGLSKKEFCKQQDIATQNFHYWSKKYKQTYSSLENEFIPIEVNPVQEITKDEIQIFYPNGVKLIFSEDLSFSKIRALINAI